MKPQRDGLRKAAILVSALDPRAAEAVLLRVGPRQAEAVRRAAGELGRIDPREQRRVIDEFFRIGPMVPGKDPPGIELDRRVARKLAREPAPRSPAEPNDPPAPAGPPFRFLHEAEADKLARILAGERPQTIALVLSHLPQVQAGAVLARLADGLQVDVVRRLVDLEETAPEILREVERGLQARLSQQVPMQRPRAAGPAAVAGILQAAEGPIGANILDNLAAHDPGLAERLAPARFEFDDLAALDDATLRTVLAGAGPELVILALTGAAPELVRRVLGQLPPADARIVRRRLEQPGPTRLSDVEEARRRIAAAARRMAAEGRIHLPRSLPQTAAAIGA